MNCEELQDILKNTPVSVTTATHHHYVQILSYITGYGGAVR